MKTQPKKRIKYRLIALTLTLMAFQATLTNLTLEAKELENDLQQWNIVTLRADLPKKFQLYAEVQPRIGNNITHIDRLLVRPALGYQVTKNISLWQGYAWTPTFQPKFNDEQRLWQQVMVENHIKKLSLTNRTRLEERFIQGAGDTAVRARHLVRASYPIGHSQKWSIVGYEELFLNLNDTTSGPQAGFDQNRIFLGLNRKLNQHTQLEGGYMLDHLNRYSPTPDKLNHVILVGLNFRV